MFSSVSHGEQREVQQSGEALGLGIQSHASPCCSGQEEVGGGGGTIASATVMVKVMYRR